MKKLIAMMAALATGFFAFGDDATPSNAKATFETDQGYVAGTTISNLTAESANTYYWLLEEGADEESGTVTAYADGAAKPKEGAATVGGDQYLAVETGAQPIYRSITSHTSNVKTLDALTAVDISDTGIFLDSQVKFTPSAENPTYTAGTKLIVWAQEIEADPDNEIEAATNLVVTAGSYDDPMKQAVFKLVVPENFDFTAWHRLTIRAIKEVTADDRMISGFCIFVDGTQMAADASDYETKVGLTKSDLTTMGGKFFDKQQLFLSCSVANDDNQALRAFGVQGSGAVDNLAAYDKDNAKQNCSFALGEIQFAVVYTDTEIATLTAKFLDGTEIPAAQIGEYAAGKKIITVDGSVEQIKLAATPATGYMIVNETASPWTLDTASEKFEILTKKIGFVVDGVNFAEDDFENALKAAQLADVPLTLAQDFVMDMDEKFSAGLEIAAATVIDLAGNDIVVDGNVEDGGYESAAFTVVEGGSLMIVDTIGGGAVCADGTFDAALVTVDGGAFTLGNGTDAGAKIAGVIDAEEGVTLVNGFVSQENETIPEAWLAEGKEAIDNGDGFWKIAPIQATPFAIILADGTTKYFDTLDEAIAAAGEGEYAECDTVTLMGNCERADWILINKTVTIDLNGNSITVPDVTAFRANDATNAKRDSLFVVLHGGALTIDDTSVAQTGLIDVSSDTRINSVVKMTKPGDTDDTLVAAFTLNAGTLKGSYYGITGNGNPGRGNTAITINGGTIIACNPDDNAGIYNPQAGTLTINGGTIEGATGVYIKAGECVCSVSSEATIKGNGNQHDYQPSGNGIHSTGDAIVLDNMGYPGGDPNADIAGGTFVSANGAAVASYSDPKKPALAPITGFVTGGTFTGAVKIDDAIAGGTYAFGPFVPGQPQTPVPAVAQIGDVNYASFKAAFDAAQSGNTITLLANVTDATGLTTSGKGATFALTIDFNGKTYTVSKPGAGSTGTEKAAFQFTKGQTIVLKNGTMQAAADNLVKATAPDKNIYRFVQNYANLTLKDMTFDATYLYIDPNHAEDYFPSAVEVCYGTVSIAGATSINDKDGMVSLTVDTYKQKGGAYKEGADVTINTTGTIASILCYSEGPYAGEDQLPSKLDLEAGTIGSIAMAGGEDVVVTKSNAVTLDAPEGYEWKDGVLVKRSETTGFAVIIAGTPAVTNYCASLAAAVEAAKAGETVAIMKADQTNADAITIDKAITLDLGGFTLTSSAAITIAADTTIANGTIATTGAITVNAGAALTLAADAEIDGNIVEVVYVKGTFNVYGTVDSTAYAASYAIVPNADGFVLNCYEGCVVKGKAQAIKINCQGTEAAPIGGTVNISGGYFTSDGNSYAPIKFNKSYNKTVLNLTGGTFDGHASIIGVQDWTTFWANNEKLTDACKAKFDNINEAESLKDMFKSIAEFVADGYALVKGDDNYYTIQKAYKVTFPEQIDNGTLETSVTNNIVAGTTVTVTATPAEGFKLVSITTNGTALAEGVTTFEMPAEDVEITAEFEQDAQPLDPEQPTKPFDTDDQAKKAAAAMNDGDHVKTASIKVPEAAGTEQADKDAYAALFVAVAKADKTVEIELNEAGTNALKAATAAIETAVANKLGDITAAAEGAELDFGTVTENVKPGFWYGVAVTTELGNMKTTNPANWVQATKAGVKLTATKPEGNAAFFQTKAKATNK